jgi:biotin synthase-like enzyme
VGQLNFDCRFSIGDFGAASKCSDAICSASRLAVALPKARIRLAAGRTKLSREGQALCCCAGANSIFYGDKLLTAKNPAADVDVALLRELGLHVEANQRATAC